MKVVIMVVGDEVVIVVAVVADDLPLTPIEGALTVGLTTKGRERGDGWPKQNKR